MPALFRCASVFHVRQALLQLNAIHNELSPNLLRSSAHRSSKAPAEVTNVPRLLLLYFCIQLTSSRLPGLFGSIHPEQVAQFHARFVQLRLAVTDRTTHHASDFIMLVSFHVVKDKNRSVAGREVIH